MAHKNMPESGDPVHLGEFLLETHRFPAVYFLYRRDEVVYVGKSLTLTARINQHLDEDVKSFDSVAFVKCPFNRLSAIEAHYIRLLAPKYNKCHVARKARERDSWDCNQRKKRSWLSDGSYVPGQEIKCVDASKCIIPDDEIGEFLNVGESDAAQFLRSGRITDKSIMGLLYFMVHNHRDASRAQARFERL